VATCGLADHIETEVEATADRMFLAAFSVADLIVAQTTAAPPLTQRAAPDGAWPEIHQTAVNGQRHS
jgi:hypothetical protein